MKKGYFLIVTLAFYAVTGLYAKAFSLSYINLGCVSNENCLFVNKDSLRVYPSGKRSVEAGAINPSTGSGGRMDYLVDCYNGTMLRNDESIPRPPRTGTLIEKLYNYTCTYNAKTKRSSVKSAPLPRQPQNAEYSCEINKNTEQFKIVIVEDRLFGFRYELKNGPKACELFSYENDTRTRWNRYEGVVNIIYPLTTETKELLKLSDEYNGDSLGVVSIVPSAEQYHVYFLESELLLSKTYCGFGLCFPKKIILNKTTSKCTVER